MTELGKSVMSHPMVIGIKRSNDIDNWIVKWLLEMVGETNGVTGVVT